MHKDEHSEWTVRTALGKAVDTLRRSKSSAMSDDMRSSKDALVDKSAPQNPKDACLGKSTPQDSKDVLVGKSTPQGFAPSNSSSCTAINSEIDIAASEATTLLAALLGVEKTQLSVMQEEPLSLEVKTSFEQGIERRALGEPLQYIVGEAPFRHLMLKATPAALIPRPETEMLVEVGLARLLDERPASTTSQEAASLQETLRIADVGTGTGNIALSLLQELSKKSQCATVYASDISPQALSLAEENAKIVQDNQRFFLLKSDLLADYPKELQGSFDAIFSNPPYLSDEIMETMLPAEVRDYEPDLALAGGADGLDVFRRLQVQAPKWLKKGGWLFVELGDENVEIAAEYLENSGYWKKVRVTRDLTDRPRILSAQCAFANSGCPLQ